MIDLSRRIEMLNRLGIYMLSDEEQWLAVQDTAIRSNAWFTPTHISLSVQNIAIEFLQKGKLEQWICAYHMPKTPRVVGIVMAGNIPLVGFHDFLCGFICGHKLMLKLSSKDNILLKHLVEKLLGVEAQGLSDVIVISEMLKGCDAYIATGSNNTARYFEQYFGKYPHLIRKNRTSVAILEGGETEEELNSLADDIFYYFGLGCRNVTQICAPVGYDFTHLLQLFSRYNEYINHNKYKNNFDYYLAIYLLNRVPYISNGSVLMVENALPFSAVSVVHYRFYDDKSALVNELSERGDIQAIIGRGFVPFGKSQQPALNEYPDGVDTMNFMTSI